MVKKIKSDASSFIKPKEVPQEKVKDKKKILNSELTKEEILQSILPEVKELVRIEANNITRGLDTIQHNICKQIARGLTDYEILKDFDITERELETLRMTEPFQIELKRLSYMGNYSDKDMMVRTSNRMTALMFQEIIRRGEQAFENTSDKDLAKSLKEQMELTHKLLGNDKSIVNIDITQILQEKIANKKRMKSAVDGSIILADEYPAYDEENDIVLGEFKEINDNEDYE